MILVALLAVSILSSADAAVLSKCQDVIGATTVSATFTPADGEVVFLQRLSTAAPSVSGARGFLLWDGSPVEGWTGDKVVEFPDNESSFTFVGDGSKGLQVKLENTSVATTYRICGVLTYKTSLGN